MAASMFQGRILFLFSTKSKERYIEVEQQHIDDE